MLGAIDLDTGRICRVVCGTGAEMSIDEAHPDTRRPILGIPIPDWEALQRLMISAAAVLPGIRTQSWDVALAEQGPVLLEVNYGGDLNLASSPTAPVFSTIATPNISPAAATASDLSASKN